MVSNNCGKFLLSLICGLSVNYVHVASWTSLEANSSIHVFFWFLDFESSLESLSPFCD